MKAITLHQPWASLIACGAKVIETRSWQPSKDLIGQRIAIHAGKKIVHIPNHLYPDYNVAVRAHLSADWPDQLPTGAIVAIATLTKAHQILNTNDLPIGDELLFGEYGYLRWMWFLSDVRTIEPPIETRGYQGLWNWDPPDDISIDEPTPVATTTPKLL